MTAPRRQAHGVGALCLWAAGHAARRPLGLAAVLATMLLKIGFDLLKLPLSPEMGRVTVARKTR